MEKDIDSVVDVACALLSRFLDLGWLIGVSFKQRKCFLKVFDKSWVVNFHFARHFW